MSSLNSTEIRDLFLIHYHEWRLLSYTYLENMDEAEDVVHDTIEKMLCKLDDTNKILNLKSYIYTSIKNNSIKRLNKYQKVPKFMDLEIFENPYEDDLIDSEKRAYISQVIGTLPYQSKRVFELCVMEGLKYEATAETLNISINTVKYHLKKGYKTLRSLLHDHYLFLFIAAISSIFLKK